MTDYSHRVRHAFTYKFSNGASADVPAGARTQSASVHGGAYRWVDPSIYPAGSLERHDAEHYGIRVYPDNLTTEED